MRLLSAFAVAETAFGSANSSVTPTFAPTFAPTFGPSTSAPSTFAPATQVPTSVAPSGVAPHSGSMRHDVPVIAVVALSLAALASGLCCIAAALAGAFAFSRRANSHKRNMSLSSIDFDVLDSLAPARLRIRPSFVARTGSVTPAGSLLLNSTCDVGVALRPRSSPFTHAPSLGDELADTPRTRRTSASAVLALDSAPCFGPKCGTTGARANAAAALSATGSGLSSSEIGAHTQDDCEQQEDSTTRRTLASARLGIERVGGGAHGAEPSTLEYVPPPVVPSAAAPSAASAQQQSFGSVRFEARKFKKLQLAVGLKSSKARTIVLDGDIRASMPSAA